MANEQNLMPNWKPGQSGNPKGKPKGSLGLTETLRKLLNSDGRMPVENVKEIGEDGKTTGRVFAKGYINIPNKDKIALTAIRKALKDKNMRAIEFCYNRIEGMATQSIKNVTELPEGNYDITKLTDKEQVTYLDLLKKMEKE